MRGMCVLGLPLALIAAGCLGAVDDGQEGTQTPPLERWPPQEWKAALVDPVYETVVSTIHYLDAADGTQLSLTLHLPEGLPSQTTVPTLLQLTPYQPLALRTGGPEGATQPPGPSWADFILRGAAYVEADARGTGGSEGCLDFGGSADRSDARVFHEWIVSRPWSNGVVVTDGISHPGTGSVVAHAAVPGLTAALTHAPVVSYYQDEWLQGAKFDRQYNSLYQAIEIAPPLWLQQDALKNQVAPCTGETLLDYASIDGPFTAKWADRHLARHIEPDVRSPILLTHGFVDLNVHPDHTQLYWDALPDDFPKHMVMGWWYHGWPDMEGHPAGAETGSSFSELRQRWLEATLFGTDNGLWTEPRVLVEDSKGVWHEGDQWPLEPSVSVTLYPAADGSLTQTRPEAAEVSYADVANARRGSWDGAHVAFRTEALDEARLINGAPKVTITASSDVDATKWVAYLLDEAPDGSWQRISHGYADSHSWGPEAEWRPMQPGTPYTWTLDLLPTAVVVDAGHRVTLMITSQDPGEDTGQPGEAYCFSDYRGGCYSPTGIVPATTVGRAVNTIHVGPEGTHMELSWVDPATTQKVPWTVG